MAANLSRRASAPDLQVLRETFGELIGGEYLLLILCVRLKYRGERAALEQDQGRRGAGEVRVALERVGRSGVSRFEVEADQLAQRDLEDLQLVL